MVDPIVHHGEPVGLGHEHQFFGSGSFLNLENPNTAELGDLQGQPTLCDNPADTAGYWEPTLRTTDGALVGVQQFTAYYRAASGANNGPAEVIPNGARLVAHVYNWTCGTKSGARSAPVQMIPDCRGLSGKPGLTLTSHITFPSCWDGILPNHLADEVGDTQDTAHYAYPVAKKCPLANPIGIMQLKETVQYQYVGDPSLLVLSSDVADGTSQGRSLHGDFLNGWDPSGLQAEDDNCVVPSKNIGKTCG